MFIGDKQSHKLGSWQAFLLGSAGIDRAQASLHFATL